MVSVILFAIYIANRITAYSIGLLTPIVYYPYDTNFIEGVMSGDKIGYLGWKWFIPLNPYLILPMFPLVVLNTSVLLIYLWLNKTAINYSNKIKNYYFIVLSAYIITLIIYLILSFFNDFEEHVACDTCLFEMFLESFIPYSPYMICGFLASQFIFGFLWVGVIERYLWKSK